MQPGTEKVALKVTPFLFLSFFCAAEQDVLAMVPTTSPEEADPEAMQAVEESLRLKFQRGALISRKLAQSEPPGGVKRQRNSNLDTDREVLEVNPSHDLAPEHLLLPEQQQHFVATQHLHVHSSGLQQQRQQLLQHAQQQLLQQHQPQLLRPFPTSPFGGNPQAEREEAHHQSQQQFIFPLQGIRIAGQHQQLLLPHSSAPLPALSGVSVQQPLSGTHTHLTSTPAG